MSKWTGWPFFTRSTLARIEDRVAERWLMSSFIWSSKFCTARCCGVSCKGKAPEVFGGASGAAVAGVQLIWHRARTIAPTTTRPTSPARQETMRRIGWNSPRVLRVVFNPASDRLTQQMRGVGFAPAITVSKSSSRVYELLRRLKLRQRMVSRALEAFRLDHAGPSH